jgi:hypothetical protein
VELVDTSRFNIGIYSNVSVYFKVGIVLIKILLKNVSLGWWNW